MARVRGFTEDEVDVLVADATTLVQRCVVEACAAAAANLRPAQVLAASTPAGLTAASSAHLGPSDVAVITEAWQQQVDDVIVPYVGELYTGSAVSVAVGVGEAFPDDALPGVPLVPDAYQTAYLTSVSNRLTGVGDELWEDVRNELLDGVAQGQSIDQLAARIEGVAGFDTTRAARIARTEVHGAAEAGSLAQVRYVGYDDDTATKEWVSTHDIRTRLSHSMADGQQVPLDEPFNVGGSLLQFPGDPSGAADEIINCRCTTVFDLDGPPQSRCDGALVAAPPLDATVCVMPLGDAGIGHLSTNDVFHLHDAFMGVQKIGPGYGGAKIFKILAELREKFTETPTGVFLDTLSNRQILAAVDVEYGKYGKSPKTFLQTYDAWSQTPAGKKAIGVQAPTPTHATTPIVIPKAPVISQATTDLPPIEPRVPGPKIVPMPDPAKLKVLKPAGGGQGAVILEDTTTGDRWIFKRHKPAQTTYSKKYTGILDVAAARIQSKAYAMRPAVYEFEWDGQKGSVQFMFHGDDAFPDGVFEPMALTPDDLFIMQREQIFDWMISNHDTHTGQWIRLENGKLYGIDKGQAFKFWGKDKLDWDYAPVSLLPGTNPTYSALWKAFIAGEDVDLQDPTTGPLGAWIDRLVAIPDQQYRAILTPYAVAREKAGFGSAKKFLDEAVARKNSLKQDFAALWARAVKERQKALDAKEPLPPTGDAAADILAQSLHTGVVDPTQLPAAKAAKATVVMSGDDITGVDSLTKKAVWTEWITLGGGKKVTPAYGGAKIWKLLQQLKVKPLGMKLSHLQIIRILDEQGGFHGKPKTYESVLRTWLDSAPGKKAVPFPPPSLVELPDAPTTKPVVSPASTVTVKEAQDALSQKADGTYQDVWHAAIYSGKYKSGDVVAYAQTQGSGDVLRVTLAKLPTGKSVLKVHVFKDGDWKYDGAMYEFVDFEAQYDLPGFDDVTSKVWHFVAPKSPTGTVIPGKVVGDVITPDEIWAARYKFKTDEIIATAITTAKAELRVVSTGTGSMRLQSRPLGEVDWQDVGSLVGELMPGPPSHWGAWTWKLSGDGIAQKPKKSIIGDKKVGDVVTTNDIWYGTHGADVSPGDVVAYSQTTDGTVWRIRFHPDSGEMEIQARAVGKTHFTHHTLVHSKDELDTFAKGKVWHIAKLNGDMPDELKLKTPTKYPGIPEGGEIDPLAMVTVGDEFDDYELVAVGRGGAWQFRIYKIEGYFVREARIGESGTWEYDGIIDLHDPTEGAIFSGPIYWYASNGKAALGSVSANAAKKAIKIKQKAAAKKAAAQAAAPTTPPVKAVPAKKTAAKKAAPPPPPSGPPLPPGNQTHLGVQVGEQIGDSNSAAKKIIWQNYQQYPNGTVIATLDSTYQHQRLIVVEGRLVLQEKTAAGAWKNTWLISSEHQSTYQIPGGSYGPRWVAVKETLPKPQLNAATKFVQKATGTYVEPAKAKKLATLEALGEQKKPALNDDADITGLDEADLGTVLMSFKGVSHGQLLGSPPQDILSNLWAWAVQLAKDNPAKFGKITTLGMARAVDSALSTKMGKANVHLFENKIREFLKTAAGREYVESGKYKLHAVVKEIFATEIDMPSGVTRVPGQKVHRLPGPGPYDPSVPASAFKPTRATMMADLWERAQAATRPLSVKERRSLKNWTSGAYHSWNGFLRGKPGYGKPSPDLQSKIYQAQAGMRPMPEDIFMLRGTNWDQFPVGFRDAASLKRLVGQTIEDPGFFATSTSIDFGGFGGSVKMEVEVPKGTMAAWVKGFSHNKSENELLLPAGTRFHVISVTGSGYQVTVRVRVVS